MAGQLWYRRTLNEGQAEERNWERDGLWHLLKVRSRATLAAAFAERSWRPHPWPRNDWDAIVTALNQVLSLCLQAEVGVNDKLDVTVPAFCVTGSFVDRTGQRHILEPLSRNGDVETAKGDLELRAQVEGGSLEIHVGWERAGDRRFSTFKEIATDELRTLVSIESSPLFLARPTISREAPSSESERLWDLRVRFSDFMRRFLLHLRSGEATLHPFLAFLLQPARNTSSSGHIRSGLFGYTYALDQGQRDYLQERFGSDAVHAFENVRIPFPRGQCATVYLTSRPTDAYDSAPYSDESPENLKHFEKELLKDSILMEIPVFGTPWMYTEGAPDGPEFILCVCLPKNHNGAVASDDVIPPEASRLTDRERLQRAIVAPGQSRFEPCEAQVLREMGQKLLSRYAIAYGSAPREDPAAPRMIAAAAPTIASESSQLSGPLSGVIGSSSGMRDVVFWIDRVARNSARILLLGETGVGKEVVARAIHRASPRNQYAFVAVNCAAIPEELIESELFGHQRGSFTGATETTIGKFQMAERGTLFLDEVGDMSPKTQVKVLRALREGEIQPVGSNDVVKLIDVRVIAATNVDLQKAVQEGKFRSDLYYRLKVLDLRIPPLRDRIDDIGALFSFFVDKFSRVHSTRPVSLSAGALSALRAYKWPGNVAELENLVERLVILVDGEVGEDDVREALGILETDQVAAEASNSIAQAAFVASDRFRVSASRFQDGSGQDLVHELSLFVLHYADEHPSWTVKESAVLNGDLGRARDQAGLGVAIITTELAAHTFGPEAEGRIDRCVAWARSQCEAQPPFRFLTSSFDGVTGAVRSREPDFRHTIAFAIILARTGRLTGLLESYLEFVASMTAANWPQEGQVSGTPVFTALYVAELLHEASKSVQWPDEQLGRLNAQKRDVLAWLVQHRQPSGLWSSGIFPGAEWEEIHNTAWVLHRLSMMAVEPVAGWKSSLDDALFLMLDRALQDGVWAGSTLDQRHRVEARIAASVVRARQITGLSRRSEQLADVYLGSWRDRAVGWVSNWKSNRPELDVATAAFLVEGLRRNVGSS